MSVDILQKVSALSKRKGFIYPSSEIYGGMANTYDYGPYGAELKENVKRIWWDKFIREREDIYGVDTSIMINPKVWEASGHVANFGDVMVEDKENRKRYRADHLIEEHFAAKGEMDVVVDGKTAEELQQIIIAEGIKSPDGNELTNARKFNLLFQTEIGIIEGEGSKTYLRGEIAQGLFINFKNILDSIHPKLPFGIGQAGKAFRNEITKGQFTFRTLEFDLMEFEYFFDPEAQDWNELFDYWKAQMNEFASEIGLDSEKLRWRPHEEFELAHYSKRTEDLEYKFPWGYKEMFGCAYRTDFDLNNHQSASGQALNYTYPDGKKIVPHVLEPTFGLSRLITIILVDAYREQVMENGETRVYLDFDEKIAPVKIAIFPLIKKPELQELARKIQKTLVSKGIVVEYDEAGTVGKRYRKQDEIGTPKCITVDFDSLEDGCVTVRDRNTTEQVRVKIEDL
jgi:glycyl-tRNA synthetase